MFELPTQLVDYRCALEAVDDSRNIARAYRVQATRDLFGHTIINLYWGRIGRRGSELTVSFANEEAARRFIQRTLAKRASAPRRIGVTYCLVTERDDPGRRMQPLQVNEDR
jgi:predicted DNA-binding WGR domain protein